MSRTRVEHLTEAEVRAKIEALYAAFPMLRAYGDEWCCGGCEVESVRGWLGSEGAGALEEIRTLQWLVGDR